MDRGTWHAAIHGVTKSRTWLSDWIELRGQQAVSISCSGSMCPLGFGPSFFRCKYQKLNPNWLRQHMKCFVLLKDPGEDQASSGRRAGSKYSSSSLRNLAPLSLFLFHTHTCKHTHTNVQDYYPEALGHIEETMWGLRELMLCSPGYTSWNQEELIWRMKNHLTCAEGLSHCWTTCLYRLCLPQVHIHLVLFPDGHKVAKSRGVWPWVCTHPPLCSLLCMGSWDQ